MQSSNQSSKSRRQRANKSSRSAGMGELRFAHPPSINPQIRHSQRMRYVVSNGGAALTNQQVTFANILDGIIVAMTSTTASKLFDQVRIRAVEIWAAGLTPASGVVNTPAFVAVTWNGDQVGASGSGRVYSDTSVSIVPAHVRAVPEKLSQASQWQANGAGNAFLFTAPNGAIIDVEVEFRNDDSAPTASAAVVGATAGEIYYRGLDSVAIATTQLVPQAPMTR